MLRQRQGVSLSSPLLFFLIIQGSSFFFFFTRSTKMIVATKMDGFQEFFLPLTVCSYIDRRILTYRSYRRYIVLFTVTISRFLSLETTFPPPPRYPCCIPRSPTRSLFLVRILFINRDRSVSLFRRRRRRRRAKNVGTFRGKCRRGSLKPDIYRVRL